MILYVDLFAGIGGIKLAFEAACAELGIGAKCVLSSEIDPQACETYRLNFGEQPSGDIRGIDSFPDFDFMLAGFPCQPFSYAGKHEGFGDTRGTLFFEIERILMEKHPKAFLLENVRGLTTHDKGRTFKTIIHRLKNLGYGVKYFLLNSSNFNIPQNRVRVYILGVLGFSPITTLVSDVGSPDSHKYKSKQRQSTLLDNSTPKLLVKDILEQNADPKYSCSEEFVRLLSGVVGSNFSQLDGKRLIDYRHGNSIHSWELGIKGECTEGEIAFMNMLVSNRRKKTFGADQDGKKLTIDQIKTFYHKQDLEDIIQSLIKKGYLKMDTDRYNPMCGNMSFEVFKFLDPDSISITLTSSDAHKLGVVQNNIPRRLTPRECARLQGFPDSFQCHPNDKYAYHQFGNSVTVPVVEAVLKDFLMNNMQALALYSNYMAQDAALQKEILLNQQ